MLNDSVYSESMMEGIESVSSVLRLDFESFHGSNRNVTYNNWFASVPLAEQMKSSPIKCSVIDTFRENKKEIPVNSKVAFDVEQSKILYHREKHVCFIHVPPEKRNFIIAIHSSQNWQN